MFVLGCWLLASFVLVVGWLLDVLGSLLVCCWRLFVVGWLLLVGRAWSVSSCCLLNAVLGSCFWRLGVGCCLLVVGCL